MSRIISSAAVSLLIALSAPGANSAEKTTGWQEIGAFYDALAEIHLGMTDRIEDWVIPIDFGVRVANGTAEYRVDFGKLTGDPFGYQVYAVESREAAEMEIELHRDPPELLGGPDKLCLSRLARAVDGDKEYMLLYLTESDVSGLRCINLPAP